MTFARKTYPPELVEKWIKLIESGSMDAAAIGERWGLSGKNVVNRIYTYKLTLNGESQWLKQKLVE